MNINMNRIIESIDSRTSWKRIVLSLIASIFLGTCLITMMFGLIRLNPEATMDSLNYYNSDLFFHNLEIQGDEGRQAYLLLHIIDYIFISQFYLLFIYLINVIVRRLSDSLWLKSLCLIPVLSALMDFTENICIDISIFLYPRKVPWLGNLSGICTSIKMNSINLVLLLLPVLLGFLMYKNLKRKMAGKI